MSYTERMEVDGHPISEEEFAYGVSAAIVAGRRVNARRDAAGRGPTTSRSFDTLTVAAMVAYARAGVDVAVLECGMGARWDATSACRSIESVAVTGVGLDHCRILGDTLERSRPRRPPSSGAGRSSASWVLAPRRPTAEDVFVRRCREQGVTPTLLRPEVLSDAEGELPPASRAPTRGCPCLVPRHGTPAPLGLPPS